MQKTIYQPAAMSVSGSFFYGDPMKNLVMPLARTPDGWVETRHRMRGSSAGGGYSTVRDILSFSKALKNPAIVKSETFRNMVTMKTAGLKEAEGYGYGFILTNTPGACLTVMVERRLE